MAKKTLEDLGDLSRKRVLIRVDFNVPLDKEGDISNDRRIRAALPTIRRVTEGGGMAIAMSHLGRPKGDPAKDALLTMEKVAGRLGELLGTPAKFAGEVVGEKAKAAADLLQPGETLVLDNLRFHPGEQQKEGSDRDGLADALADLADVYVNDAFGTCHRKDCSMVAVPKAMAGKPHVVGMLVAKELEVLDGLLSEPKRPMLSMLGGAKVSDKIGFIKALLQRVDKVLVGGAMSYTFFKAQGREVGDSLVENDKLDTARELLELGKGKIELPDDYLIADKPDATASTQVVDGDIPAGWGGMDIGPKTAERYAGEIAKAGTVVWNGPVGKFEDEPFRAGTRRIAEAMAASGAVTVVGGGETAEAVERFGLDEKMTHVSTGGGAFLEYVEGTPFAALAEIDEG